MREFLEECIVPRVKSDGTMQLQLINTVGMKYCEAV